MPSTVACPGFAEGGIKLELDPARVLQVDAGSARIELRVPVDSFESGHGQIDRRFRSQLAAPEYPEVTIEGVVHAAQFEGTVSLKGVTGPLSIPVRVARRHRVLGR